MTSSIGLLIVFLALIIALVVAAPFSQQNEDQFAFRRQDLRLIETAPGLREWMTEEQILMLKQEDKSFMDVTDYPEPLPAVQEASIVPLPDLPRFPGSVQPMTKRVDPSRIRSDLTTFSSFFTRYYNSDSGVKSSEWLFDTISAIADASKQNITVRKFAHKWKQFSIIARFEIPEESRSENWEETVIVGAHLDSINLYSPANGRAPGADDDGSGTTTILEAFRVLANSSSDFLPSRTVEFHWYSGEEMGLLGSQAVASSYQKEGRRVVAMLQNDMTGYPAGQASGGKVHFGIVQDFTDPELTRFLKKLIDRYTSMNWVDTKCGYACSDHASWVKYGYRAAFPFEGAFNEHSPFVHTPKDDITTVDFEQMAEFARLAISFATELSRP